MIKALTKKSRFRIFPLHKKAAQEKLCQIKKTNSFTHFRLWLWSAMADYEDFRRHNSRDIDGSKRSKYVTSGSSSVPRPTHYDYSGSPDTTLQGAPAHHRYFPRSDTGHGSAMPWLERRLRTMEKYVFWYYYRTRMHPSRNTYRTFFTV